MSTDASHFGEKIPVPPSGNSSLRVPSSATYPAHMKQYVEITLNDDERKIYESFYKEIKDKNQLEDLEDLMLLDIAVHDFIRLKRLHQVIREEGEIVTIVTKNGSYTKVADHSNLANAIEVNIRNSLKELGMSRKDKVKRIVKDAKKDFSSLFDKAKAIEVSEDVEGKRSIRVERQDPSSADHGREGKEAQ
jgi:hypothetical protein